MGQKREKRRKNSNVETEVSNMNIHEIAGGKMRVSLSKISKNGCCFLLAVLFPSYIILCSKVFSMDDSSTASTSCSRDWVLSKLVLNDLSSDYESF